MAAAVAEQQAPPALTRGRINVIFVTIILGMLMAALDQTIVATALPTIVADLGDPGQMAWLVTAYLLAETISTAVVGKFGDMFGRKVVFQISAVVFIAGSALSGLAWDMTILIIGRAIQGVGAGGLMVTAMALIADVIPLRERGKYQGAMGAVFGVTTVIGPTVGGLFTDHLSWHWCFYINVPIAVIMIAMAAKTIPVVKSAEKPVIDYLGLLLVAGGSSSLILGLEWGGDEYEWGSPVIFGLFATAVVLLTAFVFVERRAVAPILPMHLFHNPVFTVSSILSFIVGFAMLGAMTYLPTYLQYVDGVTATASGIRTLPMVIGLLVTSILSGIIVSRTGRYKIFPIVGTAVMALGLYLMSTMGADATVWQQSLYMLVLGLGIGLAMQVLTIAVQNTVPYHEMGAATSGVTFFRTLGSAFGTAIFGTLFTNKLNPRLAEAYAQSPGIDPATVASPAALHALPDEQITLIVDAYADAIDYVFFWVVPVAVVGFIVAWFLKEVPLRDSARAGVTDMGEGFAAPDTRDENRHLERAVSQMIADDRGVIAEEILADSGSELGKGQAWLLAQVHIRSRWQGGARLSEIAAAHHVPPQVLRPAFAVTAAEGYVRVDGDHLALTTAGRDEMDLLVDAWQRWIHTRLSDWNSVDRQEQARFTEATRVLAVKLLNEDEDRFATSVATSAP
ncbi:MDR family MFS transporter [Phytomonospora sp. NPDC050363]|uniref:MDR family MFS transporter n=1 Tax=Phytomonospora sp. NPDC050363 TaxID=3155642 RepID=UPI0033CC66FE